MLALHLPQSALARVNTLLLQQILAGPWGVPTGRVGIVRARDDARELPTEDEVNDLLV
jgi:hypothetical protein